METILSWLQSGLSGVGPLFILLGLLIFVHELGHFMVAKFFGVRVEVFSLGFGKKIFQTQRGETTYCISLIPLGGYVKMFGDDPTKSVASEEKPYSFLDKPVSQRIAIVLAGPLMNLFFAGLLFFMIALIGQEVPGSVVGDVAPSSRAYEAGFRSGDKVLEAAHVPIKTWRELSEIIQNSVGKTLDFKVQSENSEEVRTVSTNPTYGPSDDILTPNEKVGTIEGLAPESLSSLIGIFDPQGLAATAGLRSLDFIEKIDGADVHGFRNLEGLLKNAQLRDGKALLSVFEYHMGEEPKRREVSLNLESLSSDSPSILNAIGVESAELYLLRLKPNGPAMTAGLQRGDKVIAIDGTPITEWEQVLNTIKTYDKIDTPVNIEVLRNGLKTSASVTPEMTDLMNAQGQEESRYTIGIYPGLSMSYPPLVLERTNNPFQAVSIGIEKSYEWSKVIVLGFVRMFQGDVSPKNIGSLITIGKYASHSFEAGLSQFLRMMAIISINLFLINLLPVPVLDGGHLVFFSIEALRGAPLSMRKMEIAQQFGLVILISLMVFALFNDISNLFSAW
ncbi:MAG: RIP metalloprotease RseP [Bdellovibrionales bacterium]|nr:RIP metalloprotease RseP [Bdellovibrionales bacterium]